jgi:uncharacterized protein YbaR (Trm112 family)
VKIRRLNVLKKELLDIICCPTCKGDLTLFVKTEEKDDVITGSLTCNKCNTMYSIEDGIPDLLPEQ